MREVDVRTEAVIGRARTARFSAIHRGLPQISPSLLARRLEELERAGILEARPSRNGQWRDGR